MLMITFKLCKGRECEAREREGGLSFSDSNGRQELNGRRESLQGVMEVAALFFEQGCITRRQLLPHAFYRVTHLVSYNLQ